MEFEDVGILKNSECIFLLYLFFFFFFDWHIYSRLGAEIRLPESFLENIQSIYLDGELWYVKIEEIRNMNKHKINTFQARQRIFFAYYQNPISLIPNLSHRTSG
jgi:hypothetical protein